MDSGRSEWNFLIIAVFGFDLEFVQNGGEEHLIKREDETDLLLFINNWLGFKQKLSESFKDLSATY